MKFIFLLPLCALAAIAAAPEHATIAFADLTSNSQARALAADPVGNLFVISNIANASGTRRINVLKTDPEGNTLASLDFGGTGTNPLYTDGVSGAAIDPRGNLVILGSTAAQDFPLVNPLISNTGGSGAFVVVLDSQLKGILFSTKLGGTKGSTLAGAVAVDKAGTIYVTGSTADLDFPITSGAFQTQPPQSNEFGAARYAYVTAIRSDWKAIAFSTYFGDSALTCLDAKSACANEFARTGPEAMALDAAGNVIIAGWTNASHLPITPGVIGPNCGDCLSSPYALAGFAAKLSADGSRLMWATYVPASSGSPDSTWAEIEAIAQDAAGNVILGGRASQGLTVTRGALQTVFPGPSISARAGFVMKLDSTAQRMAFSTYLGGEPDFTSRRGVSGLIVDGQDALWVTGTSPVDRLPVSKGALVFGECCLASLSPDGAALDTVFTAPLAATAQAIALTGGGSVTILGWTGTLLTARPGAGPSLMFTGNSAGLSVSNVFAPLELISLYGMDLGPRSPMNAQVVDGVVSKSLGGVQVLFDGTPAPLLFVGPTQINAVVPGNTYGKDSATMRIVTPTGTIKELRLKIHPSQPGVFGTVDRALLVPVATALNEDGSVNSAANPAAGGSVVTVWASGAGISSEPRDDGSIVSFFGGGPIFPVAMFSSAVLRAGYIGELLTGPLSLEVLSAQDTPGLVAGITQIRFRLPAQLAGGPSNTGFSLRIGDVFSDYFTLYLKAAP